MTSENTLLFAVIAPSAALAGVVITQLVNAYLTRRSRHDARLASSRPALEKLQTTFATFRHFVSGAHSVTKREGGRIEEVLEAQWSEHEIESELLVESLPFRRGRKVLRIFLSVLQSANGLHHQGLGLRENVRLEMWEASSQAFDVVSALLRGDRVPYRSMKQYRKVRRDLYWYGLERKYVYELQDGMTPKPTGVLRRAWRKASRWISVHFVTVARPIRQFAGFLFRP